MNLILLTNRLMLRPLELGDVDLGLEMFKDPEVVKYVGQLMTDDEVVSWMLTWIKRGGIGGCIGIWCIIAIDTGEKLGTCTLLPIPVYGSESNWEEVLPDKMPEGDIEIGFILKKTAWREGYATEVCKRLIQFAFEQSPMIEIVATFDDSNIRSRHVLEKCGFRDIGRRMIYGDNSPYFHITREQWLGDAGVKI